MSRSERLRWFINSARGKHGPNASSLADHFGISRTTAKRDLDYLKNELAAPLRYMPSQRGFALSDPTWRLPITHAAVDTALAIATARQLLRAVSPDLEMEFNAAVARHEGAAAAAGYDAALEVTSTRSVGHDGRQLRALLEACSARQRVEISFASVWSEEEPRWRDVAPWLVHRHDDHLYLHGFCHEARDARCFSLAGISAVRATEGRARREPRGFRKSILRGIGVGAGQLQQATVRLFGAWARYAAQEIWHPKQVDRWEHDDDKPVLCRTFAYALEAEAVRRLLCCGGEVEVRSPLTLRRALAAAFSAGAERNASDGREVGAWSGRGRSDAASEHT